MELQIVRVWFFYKISPRLVRQHNLPTRPSDLEICLPFYVAPTELWVVWFCSSINMPPPDGAAAAPRGVFDRTRNALHSRASARRRSLDRSDRIVSYNLRLQSTRKNQGRHDDPRCELASNHFQSEGQRQCKSIFGICSSGGELYG